MNAFPPEIKFLNIKVIKDWSFLLHLFIVPSTGGF